MLKFLRKPNVGRGIAAYFLLSFLAQIFAPTAAIALTSGPGQEEFASFEPAATTDMVDMYTGDYNYNIPLLSVPGPNGGYPINIAYHSGIGMEQEASWVGLGWTLNVGAITRNLRGLPDDFNGDRVKKTQHVKDAITTSLDIPTSVYSEFIGMPTSSGGGSGSISNRLEMYYNNYKGLGIRYTFSASRTSGSSSLGLAVSHDSQSGMGIGLSFNAATQFYGTSAGFGLGANYNSRQGLQSFNFSTKSGKASGTSTLSFGTTFGVPRTGMNSTSTTVPFTMRFPLASSVFRFQAYAPISGSVYTSKTENDGVENVAAVGYMNTNGQTDAMRDFCRKDEGMYSKKIPHLPSSSFTYDLYTQTGQGTGSMFRPHLNTFGVLSDPRKVNKDQVTGFGLEMGIGITLPLTIPMHMGIDFQYGDGQNASGPWTQINDKEDWSPGLGKLINWHSSNSNVDYEPYYFQVYGEKTGHHAADDQLATLKGDVAVRLKIKKEETDNSNSERHLIATDQLINHEYETPTAALDGNNQTTQTGKRAKRSTSIETLTTAETHEYGFSKDVTYLDGTIKPKDFSKPAHHISEISMLQADGMRYVYGLPAYNNSQVENVFAVTEDAAFEANHPDAEIHEGGSRNVGGINVTDTYDEYVAKTELPAYAHSWLLTSVLSADYLDVTGNGPTDDDFGYWVKFNYEKAVSNYKWRIPYSKANYLDGTKNNPNDNRGSYTYGTKDIYILASIETKTHIAVFNTSARRDAFEAEKEMSMATGVTSGARSMRKLDNVKLYAKKDLVVPVKTINFEYSYDLCQGIPNNDGNLEATGYSANINAGHGKLTLTKLYFTYQTSKRGKMSPYVFNYGTVANKKDNPDYDKNAMDRWGNYKNPKAYDYTSGITYPYLEHPYTEQDPDYYSSSATYGLRAAPWTLKEIYLPTGGTLKMEYENDDYAYVENKQATRMYDICRMEKLSEPAGVYGSDLVNSSNRKYIPAETAATEDGTNGGGLLRVYIKLEGTLEQNLNNLGVTGVSTMTPADKSMWFNRLYLNNIGKYIYFSTYSCLKETDDNYWDYVKGYAEIQPNSGGIVPTSAGVTEYGYFTLKAQKLASPVNPTGIMVNPFTLATLQHLRAYRSDVIYPPVASGSSSAAAQIMNLFAALPSQLTDLMATAVGFNNYAHTRGWGRHIQLNGYSIVRLGEPDYKKIGGGVRIKKITLNDNWKNNPSVAANSLYGQEYSYTKKVVIEGGEVEISSGVAYEPQVGGEESALRTPIPYTKSIPLHGSYNLFMENPILEDYYPGAGVGYSKVTVKSIGPDQARADNPANTLQYSAAPVTISEFYTPKDFPVIFDKTDMNPGEPLRIPIMVPGILSDFTTRQAKSQGYSLVLNDMAGKPKAVTTLTREGGQIISRQRFEYNTESAYNENIVNKLCSKVQTLEIDKDDDYKVKYITSIVGQTHDIFIDMNEDSQEMESFGIETNFDMQYTYPAALLFMVMILPTVKADQANMRTVVFNKIINRTGILKRVETTTNESTIITENLAYDIETGEPLLTKVTNEFKDPIYNFNYPGHWYYPNMSGAYNNFGLKIDPPGTGSIVSDPSGYLDVSTYLAGRKVSEFFAKGDVIHVDCAGAGTEDYHVLNIYDPGKLLLINSLGHLFPALTTVNSMKVIKSGFKNLQSVKVGSLAFQQMHATTPGDLFKDYKPSDVGGTYKGTLTPFEVESAADNKIINASAVEYSNDWQVFCGPPVDPATVCICSTNERATDFFNMLTGLESSNSLTGTNLLLYHKLSDTYYNGFTSGLFNSSQKLIDLMATALPADQELYYTGRIIGGDLYMIIHNEPSSDVVANDFENAACVIKLDVPAGYNMLELYALLSFNAAGDCDGSQLNITAYGKENEQINIGVSVITPGCLGSNCNDCWSFVGCYQKAIPNYACGIPTEQAINPYWAGMKGMWRPKSSYAYNTSRTQNDNVKEDGRYTDFVRFPWEDPATKDAKWVNATTVTKYSPHGFELENKNALGTYSSALYGYNQALVTAVGSNAKYTEIAFDNFEDYHPIECTDKHFKFSADESNVKTDCAHTGMYSLMVASNSSASVQKSIGADCAFAPIDDNTNPGVFLSETAEAKVHAAHITTSCDCLGEFSPKVSKKYVASVWVKEVSSGAPVLDFTNYTAPQMRITITKSVGSPAVYTFNTKGNIIDGWQQIFEAFDVPASATGITVELLNTASDRIAYFDDIRLHPFDGNMVSYVYDPASLKVMAELDANNFATFYIYDDEGHLNKVKKETSEGIKTIKEGRVNTKKENE